MRGKTQETAAGMSPGRVAETAADRFLVALQTVNKELCSSPEMMHVSPCTRNGGMRKG